MGITLRLGLLGLICVTGVPSSLAAEESHRINGSFVKFERDEKANTLLSRNCFTDKTSSPKCTALEALKKVSSLDEKALPTLVGGKDPGSALCKALGGRVQIGVDGRGNESSFCAFADGSQVGCGSLSYYYAMDGGGR